LVPNGWQIEFPHELDMTTETTSTADYSLAAVDRRPDILRKLFPQISETANINISVEQSTTASYWADLGNTIFVETSTGNNQGIATVDQVSSDGSMLAMVKYERTNLPAFNRTYRQICNSLTIE